MNGFVSPSWVIASIAFTSPIRNPKRAPGQQVGRLAHRLHAAGDRESEVAGADRLVGEPDRAHARGADLVDRLRGDLARDPGLDLRLARGDLALAGLQHLAVDHLLDLVGLDLGALERGAIALPPRSVASSEDSAPPILPNGVRAVPRITVCGICA